MKLFTIGDSISQGFMSGAAARTDLSYSTLLAELMGIQDYRYPEWPAYGLPANLEEIMRILNRRHGTNILGVEWATVLLNINKILDKSEHYYEREDGSFNKPIPGIEFYHNVSVEGFTVADAWLMDSNTCESVIKGRKQGFINRIIFGGDDFLEGPDCPFYRIAQRVLNPSGKDGKQDYGDYSQLDWLEKHATSNEGVENLIIWLGANNALGTVLFLNINQTPGDLENRPHHITHLKRKEKGWNLWHPDDFKAEYEELLDRVDDIMRKNNAQDWNVFVATVPLVTIIPMAKGVGEKIPVQIDPNDEKRLIYYKYYTYFPYEEEFAKKTGFHFTCNDAIHIDECIRAYNMQIKALVSGKNALNYFRSGRLPYHIVDMEKALNKMAWKRNAGNPNYAFPDYFRYKYPRIDTKYYHANADGKIQQGGIFSLDGIHPTAIGHGIIAEEFLKVMRNIISIGAQPPDWWDKICESDRLYSEPISIMQEIYQQERLAKKIIKFIHSFRD